MDLIWTNLPPITKGWCVSVVTTSVLLTIKKVNVFNLLFIPDKALTNQSWRLVTSFITFNELSLDLVFTLFSIGNSCKRVESQFITSITNLPTSQIDTFNQVQLGVMKRFIDRNKSIDFLYFLIQICVSIIIIVSLIHYKLNITLLELGRLLSECFIYIDSRNSPNEIINFMGLISFKNCYSPWFHFILNMLLSWRPILETANVQNIPIWKFPIIWIYLVSYGLGHVWWVSRSVLLNSVHYESNDTKRKLRNESLKKYKVQKLDLIRSALVVIFLPPWYWFIISKIKNRTNQ